MKPSSWVRSWSFALLGFVALAFVAYGRTLKGWFLSDDTMIGHVIPDGKHVSWSHVFATFRADWGLRGPETETRYYRPLVILSQAVDAAVWGVNPVGFHMTNVVLHGANGYLLHRLARALGAPVGAAVVGGAAFVLFPLFTEAVAWISGRTDVLCGVFMFGGAWLYVEARSAKGSRRRGLLSGAFACYALGLLTKEPAIALAPVIVALDLTTDFDFRAPLASLRRLAPAWVMFGLVAAGYLGLRHAILGSVLGGSATRMSGAQVRTFEIVRESWVDNFKFLVSPFNRSALEGEEPLYVRLCIGSGIAIAAGAALAIRGRRLQARLTVACILAFAATVAPFASMIYVLPTLENSRYLYHATAWFCLLVGILVSPRREEWPSLVPPAVVLGILGIVGHANVTPWVEAAGVMETVTRTYARTFGIPSGELIENLPLRHHGAYMALYNASSFAPQFTPDAPVRLDSVIRSRARYSVLDRDLRILPDPVYGAADRLSVDRAQAEWLLPPDGATLDAATIEGLERVQGTPGLHTYRPISRNAWLIVGASGNELPHVPGAEEFVYLSIRPAPAAAPNLFWVDQPGQSFGDPRYVTLRAEEAVTGDRIAHRDIGDGFVLFVYPLHEHRHWRGMEHVQVVRVDPHVTSGTFDIGFLGIARRKPSEADVPAPMP